MKTLRANALKKAGQTLPSQDVFDKQVPEKLIIITIQTQETQNVSVFVLMMLDLIKQSGIAKDNNQAVAKAQPPLLKRPGSAHFVSK
ncbi:hypothetical protein O9929_01920 [Vibrio lentus]|nr:hypothetical protein [Vibrio lentus]